MDEEPKGDNADTASNAPQHKSTKDNIDNAIIANANVASTDNNNARGEVERLDSMSHAYPLQSVTNSKRTDEVNNRTGNNAAISTGDKSNVYASDVKIENMSLRSLTIYLTDGSSDEFTDTVSDE